MAAADSTLLAYVAFTAVLVLTPGATTAVVIRNTLAGGRRAGLTAALGAATANSTHAVASGLGLAILVARFPSMLGVLRLAGGAYLAWLGASSLVRAARQPAYTGVDADAPAGPPPASFREGLAVNLLNPAIATFYLVVVPSFLPAGAPAPYFAGLAALHVGMAFTCHAAWTLGLHQLRAVFRRPAARRSLEVATGIALLGLAARILA
ncbi:MAG: LysE family translocator [Vicinamibacterales bacterium]